MMKREAAFWHMMFQYELADAFDNGRSGARSVVSRIDKFIVFQDLDTRGQGRIEAATSGCKLSDHSPLVLTIWGQPTESSK
jgi:hypothetical protein